MSQLPNKGNKIISQPARNPELNDGWFILHLRYYDSKVIEQLLKLDVGYRRSTGQ